MFRTRFFVIRVAVCNSVLFFTLTTLFLQACLPLTCFACAFTSETAILSLLTLTLGGGLAALFFALLFARSLLAPLLPSLFCAGTAAIARLLASLSFFLPLDGADSSNANGDADANCDAAATASTARLAISAVVASDADQILFRSLAFKNFEIGAY